MGLIETYRDPEYEIVGVACRLIKPIKVNFDPCSNLFLFSLLYEENDSAYPA